jgi:hypothetical protein
LAKGVAVGGEWDGTEFEEAPAFSLVFLDSQHQGDENTYVATHEFDEQGRRIYRQQQAIDDYTPIIQAAINALPDKKAKRG